MTPEVDFRKFDVDDIITVSGGEGNRDLASMEATEINTVADTYRTTVATGAGVNNVVVKDASTWAEW